MGPGHVRRHGGGCGQRGALRHRHLRQRRPQRRHGELLEEQEVDIPKELKEFDELQANIWVCNNKLLRMVLNPFKPAKIPYCAAPYELNPYSFFGVGIAENMDDTPQKTWQFGLLTFWL